MFKRAIINDIAVKCEPERRFKGLFFSCSQVDSYGHNYSNNHSHNYSRDISL